MFLDLCKAIEQGNAIHTAHQTAQQPYKLDSFVVVDLRGLKNRVSDPRNHCEAKQRNASEYDFEEFAVQMRLLAPEVLQRRKDHLLCEFPSFT